MHITVQLLFFHFPRISETVSQFSIDLSISATMYTFRGHDPSQRLMLANLVNETSHVLHLMHRGSREWPLDKSSLPAKFLQVPGWH